MVPRRHETALGHASKMHSLGGVNRESGNSVYRV